MVLSQWFTLLLTIGDYSNLRIGLLSYTIGIYSVEVAFGQPPFLLSNA